MDEISMDSFHASSSSHQLDSPSLHNLSILPFNRREVDQWNNEFNAAVKDFKPKPINFFDDAEPEIALENCHDQESIRKMKEYFMERTSRKRELVDTTIKESTTSGNDIKQRICHIDLAAARNEAIKEEIQQLREEYNLLKSKTNMMRKENDALKTRLTKYEAENTNARRRDDEARHRARMTQAAVQKQRQVLREVADVLDSRPSQMPSTQGGPTTPSVAALRKKFDLRGGSRRSQSAAVVLRSERKKNDGWK